MRDDHKPIGIEWSDKSRYNSFNSSKGLIWFDSHYVPIAEWFQGKRKDLPPPIEMALDPSHLCNFKCKHCNAQRYLTINPDEVPADRKLMTKEHLEKLLDFCADWGVKGVCLGGGGEPLMNKNSWTLPSYITSKGMKSSIITNGSLINEQIAEEMMNCRWVGISVDAGTRETFKEVHDVDYFDKVIRNLKLLVKTKEKTNSKIDLAYKFLITPKNWQDLYEACKLAKDIGVRDFHARPADLERKDFEQIANINYNIDEIQNLFRKCHELEENDRFRVFTVMHKYDPNFRVVHSFRNCVSSSLVIQACADGNVYSCIDHKVDSRFKLCSHYPNPEEILKMWGSDEHRDYLKLIIPDKECSRCTYGEYARQIEELAMGSREEDPMCVDFP